jgi:hypothetical protein
MNLMSLMQIHNADHSLVWSLEGVNPRDYSERVHTGVEYWFKDFVALRGGYKFNYDFEGFSFGAGIKWMGIEIDYAYSDFGSILGSINRFSAQIGF